MDSFCHAVNKCSVVFCSNMGGLLPQFESISNFYLYVDQIELFWNLCCVLCSG
jgi:hypothetical protein